MKKLYLFLWLLLCAINFAPEAHAACGGGASNCFVVAAGGNSNSTSTWSASSGGSTCTCTPAATDTVVLDAAAGQLTLNANLSVAGFDARGLSSNPYTGTLTHNSSITLTISGLTFALVSGMTYAPSSSSMIILFTSTSGTTAITSAGKTLPTVTFNGSGGTFQLQDNLTYRSDSALTRTAGSFDGNSKNVTGGSISLTCGTAGTITPGTATWTVKNSGVTVFDASSSTCTFTPTNLTLVANNSVTSTASRTVNLGTSKTYAGLTLTSSNTANAFTTDVTYGTAATLTNFTITGPVNVRVTAGAPMTVTNAIAWGGTAYNSVAQLNATPSFTMTLTAGGTCSWCVLGNITYATGTLTATNSFDLGGNGGTVSISGPNGARIIGG